MIVLTAFEAVPGAGTEAGLAWNWGRAYVAAGHEVTVLTSGSDASEQHAKAWCDASINVVFLGGNGQARAPQSPREFVTVAQYINRWLGECRIWLDKNGSQITAVHHVSWGSVRIRPSFLKVRRPLATVWGPLGGGQMAKFSGLLPHNRIHELVRALSFPLGWLMRRIDFLMHKAPTLTLTTNSATSAFVRSLGIAAAKEMLADGIQPERIARKSNDGLGDPVELVWLGRMVASKRADIAIGLVSKLHERGVKAKLTLIGDGPERRTLERIVNELGLSDSIIFSGRIPWEQTFEYYDKSDFLIFTSMRDSSCPAVVEAAARGLPTLCVRHQGVASLVPDSVAFGPENFSSIERLQEDLADVVENFTTHPSEYKEASRNALAFANNQTWGRKVEFVLNDLEIRRTHEAA